VVSPACKHQSTTSFEKTAGYITKDMFLLQIYQKLEFPSLSRKLSLCGLHVAEHGNPVNKLRFLIKEEIR
jgi:hypothetical protein